MQYTVKHNGATYILPVFTRGMKKKIDEVNERITNPESSVDDRVDALYGFVADVLGEENAAKALGTTDPDEMASPPSTTIRPISRSSSSTASPGKRSEKTGA